MLPTLYELLDEVDTITSKGPGVVAALRLADLLSREQHPEVRGEVEAYVRAYGFVVRPNEHPSVQLPGVYDPKVLDDIEAYLSEFSEFERERAHAVYIESLYP